jgi:Predicted integral membrane protein
MKIPDSRMFMEEKQDGKLRRSDCGIIAAVLIIKILLLAFAAESYRIAANPAVNETLNFFEIWSRWDAESYLKIAENGYAATGEDRFLIVFFPLYPLLVAVFRGVFGDTLVSAFFVSGVASVALGLFFYKLVGLDHTEKTARLSVLFMFIFPTSYFLHIPYTESLFLALTVGCFLAARRRNHLAAGFLGALACLTRINGLILIPALCFEILDEYRETRRFDARWIFYGFVPLGFGIYLALNYFVAGSPTMFLTYQREHWFRYFRVPWEGIWETYERMYYPRAGEAQMQGFQELLFVAIGLFAVVAGWRHLRNSYRVWMVLNWLLSVSTSFVLSVPRYTLLLFPLFMLMALASAGNRWIRLIFTVWSLLYLSLFTTQFVRGWWAF